MEITNEKLSIGDLMTTHPICAFPNMIMTEVAEIFEENSFHHIPVIDEDDMCIGVISESDYLQLQDKFTKFGAGRCAKGNKRFFASLLAKEVMSPFPQSVEIDDSITKVLDIFMKNKVHSVVVNENEKFRGIITTYDIIEWLSSEINLT
jgi:CBS domain-containing protein